MRARLVRYAPIIGWLPRYRGAWLKDDAVAALSVWALLIPQGLAYATIAGVPVQYGLYTAFAALVAYAIFGTGRQVVQGPSATVAAVSTAVITPLVGAGAIGTVAAAEWAAALALAVGAVYLVLGVLRMGWVANFLSRAVLAGFIFGFAIGIVIDQAPKLLGVTAGDGTYAEDLVDLIKSIPDTSATTLVVGAGSLALLLVMRYLRPKWPRALIVVALAVAVTSALDLAAHGVAITGEVPTGLFDVGLPGVGSSEVGALVVGALSVIFVGYSETLAAGRMVSRKHGYEIDPDQELIAQGVANATAGFVGGFVNDGSLSKSSVADTAGQRTQMASLINAAMVLLTMLFLASLFKDLPGAALGAVVIDAMVGLITLADGRRYYRINRPDWVFFMGAMLGILFFGIIAGIVIGVALSLLMLIGRASNPGVRVLGRRPGSDAYLDVTRHEGLDTNPGIVVVRIDGPLFFANANRFRDAVRELVAAADEPVRAVVIDAEAISQTDTDGADVITELAQELGKRQISVALARVESRISELWERAGTLEAVGTPIFHTTSEAVEAISPAPARR
ncbi:MAG: sulfate permease, SulP family [Solirubrobacterales bacterium]|nr:sulfate permease, SulP family [Solirubrobacterales bacterium]